MLREVRAASSRRLTLGCGIDGDEGPSILYHLVVTARWWWPGTRRGSVAAAGLVLLLGYQLAFVSEVRRARRAASGSAWIYHAADRWQPVHAPVRELEAFLEEIGDAVPPGSLVRFSSAPTPGNPRQSFYRFMWAAFLWPDREVIQAHVAPGVQEDFRVSFGDRIRGPGLETILETPRGVVARVR